MGSSSHEVPSPHGAFGLVGPLVTLGANPESPSALRFLQPLGGFLPTHLAGLFHPASTCRLSPSGFVLPGSRIAFRRPLPSCRCHRPASRCQATERQLVYRALLSSGLPTRSATRLSETGRGSLLGFWLFRASFPSAVGRLSASLPSRAWTRAVRDVAASAPQGISGPRE